MTKYKISILVTAHSREDADWAAENFAVDIRRWFGETTTRVWPLGSPQTGVYQIDVTVTTDEVLTMNTQEIVNATRKTGLPTDSLMVRRIK